MRWVMMIHDNFLTDQNSGIPTVMATNREKPKSLLVYPNHLTEQPATSLEKKKEKEKWLVTSNPHLFAL